MEVVRLEQLEGEPVEPVAQGFRPYAGLLSECRNQLLERVGNAILTAFDGLEKDLQLRRAAASADEQDRLAEVHSILRSRGSAIRRAFCEAFERSFRKRTVSRQVSSRGDFEATVSNMLEWSLADDDQISDELLVQNLARLMAKAGEAHLKDLRPRTAHMLDEPTLEEDDDPLGPQAITEALKEACWSLDCARNVRVEVLSLLAQAISPPVAQTFGELNVFLLARKVVPRAQHAVKRNLPKSTARESARGGPDGRPPTEQETSGILQRLFSAQGEGVPGAAAPNASRIATANLGVLQALTRLQKGESGVAIGDQTFDLVAAGAGAETINVVRGLIEKGIGRHVGSVDGIIIDVVAALFDYIFDDPHVPGAMKGLIGRLQIPMLKLAMMDHSFFSNRIHPARRLINTLAQASAGWDGAFSSESSLYRFAEPIVVRIQDEFAENREVFAEALARIEAFVAQLEKSEDEQVEALSEQLEQRERLEIAGVVAKNAMASHLANPELPESVRRFIDETWSRVLVKAAMAGSEDGAEWQDAATAMDDLAWSVQPMKGPEDRQRLVKILPTMLRAISAGLAQIDAPASLKEAFFAELMKLHAASVKASIAGAAAKASTPAARVPPAAVAPEPVAAPAESLRELARGAWLMLQDAGGDSRRVRLSWISPGRTMYLFTNHQGERALALTHRELAARLDAGTARPAEGEPLLDRVVDIILDDFEAHH